MYCMFSFNTLFIVLKVSILFVCKLSWFEPLKLSLLEQLKIKKRIVNIDKYFIWHFKTLIGLLTSFWLTHLTINIHFPPPNVPKPLLTSKV